MSKLSRYFHSFFLKPVVQDYDGLRFEFDMSKFGDRLDVCQYALDNQAWNDIKQYMPIDTGTLISDTEALNASVSGEVYCYDPSNPYGHYQNEGVVYVDPVYGVGGFYSNTYGFWSRPGVTKVSSERTLQYKNPSAVAHWGEYAMQMHWKDWVNAARRAYRS